MLALLMYRGNLGPCGHYLPHTTTADAEDRYTVDEPSRCHACTAVDAASTAYQDSPHPRALLFHARRR